MTFKFHIFAGAANHFEQQASKSARFPISRRFSSTCAIVSAANFRKYSFVFPLINHAVYI